ncbi:MAG: DUF2335 domain-containing protein [Phycisphaerae bacterium]|nr:DUF2335 domain-containing protein [Phycisphaerae bacterium]
MTRDGNQEQQKDPAEAPKHLEELSDELSIEETSSGTNGSGSQEIIMAYKEEAFLGPLPHPAILEQYNKIQPGFANRVVSMAESWAEHRQVTQRKALEAEIEDAQADRRQKRRGQWLGFLIAVIGFAVTVYAIHEKSPWVAGILGSGTLVSLTAAFVLGRRVPEDSDTSKSSAGTEK